KNMKLAKALQEKEMDVRLLDRHLGEGKLTKSEVDTYLSKLDDDQGNFEKVDADVAEVESASEITEQ
ncbi:MAG: hypothetical protein HON90_11990, partial [Halobacteriovoraceae bacterium]|nr:hypothetical protein [Halobacteriovoraceae bacterium]